MRQTAFKLKRVPLRILVVVQIGLLVLAMGQTNAQSVRIDNKATVPSAKPGFVNAVALAAPAVVSIQGEKQPEATEGGRMILPGQTSEAVTHIGMGTGIIVDPRGYIVTNYHVVRGLLKIQIATSDGTTYQDVEFIRKDLKTDLALIKINPAKPLPRIRFGKSSDVDLAEDVIAIGNPFGYQVSVSRGIVSGLHRPLKASETLYYEDVIQTDAAINPGNSGGPLINIKGEMIGLNAAVREGAENIAFAIPVDIVSSVVENMINLSVAKTRHGMTLRSMSPNESGNPLPFEEEDTLVVESIQAGSPAEQAGIQKGDVLLISNGQNVHSTLDVTCSLIETSAQESILMQLWRGGRKMQTSLALSGTEVTGTEQRIVVQANRPTGNNSFESAPASPSYGAVSEGNGTRKNGRIISVSDSVGEKVQAVWDNFGVEIEPLPAKAFKEQYPHLSVVSMGKSKIYPAGGVRVTNIDDKSLFRARNEKVEKNDLLFGFVLGDSEENRWGITSLDDLFYIAQKWDELKQDNSVLHVRVYLIRDNTPYFLDLEF